MIFHLMHCVLCALYSSWPRCRLWSIYVKWEFMMMTANEMEHGSCCICVQCAQHAPTINLAAVSISSRLGSGWRLATSLIPLDAHSHHSLDCSESVDCTPQQLSQSTRLVHLDHLWKPSAQLARSSDWPFQSSNVQKNYGTRSNWYARYPPNPLRTVRALMIILCSISMFAGRIGESGALGSAHRI